MLSTCTWLSRFMVMEQAQVQIISGGLVMYYLNGNCTMNKVLKMIYIIAWEQGVITVKFLIYKRWKVELMLHSLISIVNRSKLRIEWHHSNSGLSLKIRLLQAPLVVQVKFCWRKEKTTESTWIARMLVASLPIAYCRKEYILIPKLFQEMSKYTNLCLNLICVARLRYVYMYLQQNSLSIRIWSRHFPLQVPGDEAVFVVDIALYH